MKIRQIQNRDIDKLKEIHSASGFDYKFPNLNEFFPIPAVVDENDIPVLVVASLPTVELFLLADSTWETPGIRMEAFKLIHEFVRRDLQSRGIVEAVAWIPPELSKSFLRRLNKMGWNSGRGWPCYSRRTDQ